MNALDAYQATRNLVESAFSHLTWYEDVCLQSGFKGISQVWKEEPAWYFWLNRVDGAFLLRLHAEESLADNQYVSLTLHYFPAPGEDLYQQLSAGEKWLLSDDAAFDRGTNTPRFEAYEQFVSLFVAAEIGFVIDPDNQLGLLLFSSAVDAGHPARQFLSLLVTACNFFFKRHQQHIFAMRQENVPTMLISYSASMLARFMAEFRLRRAQLEDISAEERFVAWKHAAHMKAVCSMTGACSCRH